MRLNLWVHFKIESPFKLAMLIHLIAYNSAKNNSMKGERKGTLFVALEGAPKIFFQGALKVAQECEEKDTFDVFIDGILDSAIEGVIEGALKSAINNLYKDAQETK